MLFKENFFVPPEEYLLYFEFLEQNKDLYTVVLNVNTTNPQLYLEKCEDPNILGIVRVFVDEESCIVYLNQILKLRPSLRTKSIGVWQVPPQNLVEILNKVDSKYRLIYNKGIRAVTTTIDMRMALENKIIYYTNMDTFWTKENKLVV
jgi:hypothetical protein